MKSFVLIAALSVSALPLSTQAAHKERAPGEYASVAERLIWRAQSDYSRSKDRAAWKEATYEDSLPAYAKYRKEFPNGIYAQEASARIIAFEMLRQEPDIVQQMTIEDRVLAKNKPAALEVEKRLARLGFDPGRVDGKFDKDTQRAVRRYQRSRGLPVSGFVTKDTQRMLMGG